MGTLKMIVYPFAAAIAALVIVELAAVGLFGTPIEEWTEWQNRTVSIVGTIAGFAGAVVGVSMAVRAGRRELK
jgi:H+/Cl- antiporter ClcA